MLDEKEMSSILTYVLTYILTFDNDASSIPSIPSIWPTPLLARLTVEAAHSFTTSSSHELYTSMVYKVTDLEGKKKEKKK